MNIPITPNSKLHKLPVKVALATAKYYIKQSITKSYSEQTIWNKTALLSEIEDSLPDKWSFSISGGTFFFRRLGVNNSLMLNEKYWPNALQLDYPKK